MIETAQTNISQDDIYIIFTTIQNQFQISMNGMTTKMHSKTILSYLYYNLCILKAVNNYHFCFVTDLLNNSKEVFLTP